WCDAEPRLQARWALVASAAEVLLATSAVRNLIREGKSFQLDNVIQTSSDVGMTTLNASLASLLDQGRISQEVAVQYGYVAEGMRKVVGQM
ncbi:MAG: hypothetical protein AAB612_01580, partial [Patescibacteria group bacterium]